MKKIFIAVIALSLLSIIGYAQSGLDRLRNLKEPEKEKLVLLDIPQVNGAYEYQQVITMDSTYSKERLYQSSKIFFADYFKDANKVIQYDNREDGKIVGKGHFLLTEGNESIVIPMSIEWDVWFTLEITSKDAKYRYRIYDIYIQQRNTESYSTQNISIDDAIKQTKKGAIKKIGTNLFNRMAGRFVNTEMSIRNSMEKHVTVSKDDF